MVLTVPERIMWVACQAMRDTAGPQAPTILTRAGLARFVDQPPFPQGTQLVATQAELIHLYQQVYALLGEGGIRLFYRNYGDTTSRALLQLPEIQQWSAEAARLPAAQQLGWFVQTFTAWTAQSWTPQRISEDERAWYMTQEVCYFCDGIHDAHQPLCAVGVVLNQRLARAVLGRAVRVEEVTCQAMGASYCTYAIYK